MHVVRNTRHVIQTCYQSGEALAIITVREFDHRAVNISCCRRLFHFSVPTLHLAVSDVVPGDEK